MPRLLPQVPPPAVAEGWLVLKKVVPPIEIALPTTFSPLPSVMNQPRSVPSFAVRAATSVWPAPTHAADVGSWMQLSVRSDIPGISPGLGAHASPASGVEPSVIVGSQVVAPVIGATSLPLSLNI